MGKSYHLNVMVDAELERGLRAHAKANDLKLSAVARDLLRHALGVVPTQRDAGWVEGYNAGLAAVNKTVREALGRMTKEQAT